MGTVQETTSPPPRPQTDFSTSPRQRPPRAEPRAGGGWAVGITTAAVAVLGGLAWALASGDTAPEGSASLTLLVFATAVVAWCSGRFEDVHVAVAATSVLVLLGVLTPVELLTAFGAEPIWLMLSAFLLAAGLTRTGLPARLVATLAASARTPRQLAHLTTVALVVSALLVPSTSGRAAIAVPVHSALAEVFERRERLVRGLALLIPTVILLSAVSSLVGAGAHLITSQILAATTGSGIGYAQWLLWGLPLAITTSHLAAELVLLLHTRRADRREPLRVPAVLLRSELEVPHTWRSVETRAAWLLAVVVLAWSTSEWHGIPAPLPAFAAALMLAAPRTGVVSTSRAVSEVPWSLLVFMATTAAMGGALVSTGAAQWLADAVLGGTGYALVGGVVAVSAAAHLVVQSRSARSSVLIPMVVPAALAAGMNPIALAFASTAAAGFCHTLTSSAKPVAVFSRLDAPTYGAKDLLVLSAFLGPLLVAVVLLFSVAVWPLLGLPLH